MSGLSILGAGARWTRRLGLGAALRSVRDCLDRIFVRLQRPPLKARVDGLMLHGYLRHRSFLAHVASGTYETTFRRLFEDALAPGTTVVDGGAHLGLYSSLACRRVGSAGRVIAFEPDPYNAAALEFNVRRAGCANVTIVRKALADTPGRAVFQQSLGTISSSFEARSGRGPFREIEATVASVDEELGDSELSALVIKLDVEGAETRALAGMAKTIARAESVVLFVEVNPTALAANGTDAGALLAQLDLLGLKPSLIDEDGDSLAPVSETGSLRGNLYCVRA